MENIQVSYNSKTKLPESNMNKMVSDFFSKNGKFGILILVIIIVYVVVLIYLGKSDSSPRILEIVLWTIFTAIVLANLWFFKKPPPPLKAIFKPGFKDKIANVDVHVKKEQKSELNLPLLDDLENRGRKKAKEEKVMGKLKKQVYHIPNNKYNYLDGKAICKAYGGRLAKYDELEDAYENGANWCSYGWSENQMALFPTQKKTWDKLQKIKGHENDCGRPGVNGGYIKNPNVRFGINCFGPKPDQRPQDHAYMKSVSTPPYNKEQSEIDKKEQYWKKQIDRVLVAPFNNDSWSTY